MSAEGWSGGGLDDSWSGKVMKISKMACIFVTFGRLKLWGRKEKNEGTADIS